MPQKSHTRRTVLKTLGTATVGAAALTGSAAAHRGGLKRELATVRSATASYNDPENAVADGYVHINPIQDVVVPLTDVLENGFAVCGMGYHFLNPQRVGSTDPTAPTVVVYGVGDDGDLVLGAVEWIVPKALGFEENPPDLFDHDDGAEAAGWEEDSPFDGVWALHAWVHNPNPDGVFNPTNPREQFHPAGCHHH